MKKKRAFEEKKPITPKSVSEIKSETKNTQVNDKSLEKKIPKSVSEINLETESEQVNIEPLEKNIPKQFEYSIDTKNAAALYTLWFGLDYGSILTAYALYQIVNQMGKKSYLIEKPAALWSEHYAEKDNIAGKFIYKYCDVIPATTNKAAHETVKEIDIHIVGSDVVWDCEVIGKQADKYFYLDDVEGESKCRISYGTSIDVNYDFAVNKINDYSILLHKFQGISVKSLEESLILSDIFHIQPEIVLDPVFLCDKASYLMCAEQAVAKKIEKENHFIFTYIKNGNERKRSFVLKGNNILLETYLAPLRNFIDINRYPESKASLGLDPAYHILVEDWLYYLINSDFVITDDYYGMCFAILFEKNFVVICDKGIKDISRYTTLLNQLDLMERLVYTNDDFKKKEYLFRKPIRYNKVNSKLTEMQQSSYKWLSDLIANKELTE